LGLIFKLGQEYVAAQGNASKNAVNPHIISQLNSVFVCDPDALLRVLWEQVSGILDLGWAKAKHL